MMQPYLTILFDSFRETIGNRVLWAMLFGWTLILLAISPFGYVAERDFQLRGGDIAYGNQLATKLATGLDGSGKRSIVAVASQLSPNFKERLRAVESKDSSSNGIENRELARELSVALRSRDLYSPEAFPTAERRSRLKELIDEGVENLDQSQLEELNRELLQIALPLELSSPSGESLWIGYAGFKVGEPLPISRSQVKKFINPIILGAIVKLGLGVVVVFVAIIVTSPVIPDTFRPQALHLLLSKPISRVGLLLTKYLGGCIFALLNISYVIVGLFFIAGFRLELWSFGLLGCIPLLTFVFLIFFAVSTLVGLLWGNSIVSVVACALFWLLCTATGFVYQIMYESLIREQEVRTIAQWEEMVFAVNEQGAFEVWNESLKKWQPAIDAEARSRARTFGPVFDKSQGLMYAKQFFFSPFEGLNSRARQVSVVHFDKQKSHDSLTKAVDQADELNAEKQFSEPALVAEVGRDLPEQLYGLFSVGEKNIALCRSGIYELVPDKERPSNNFFNLPIPWGKELSLPKLTEESVHFEENLTAAVRADASGVIVFHSGTIEVYSLTDDGKFKVLHSRSIDGDPAESALVAMNQDYAVVARNSSSLQVFDKSLQPYSTIELGVDKTVRQMDWLPGGKQLLVLSHSGELWKVDCESGKAALFPIGRGYQLTSFFVSESGKLWFAEQPDILHEVELESRKETQVLRESPSTARLVFSWVIAPFYAIAPKPAALDDTMTYLLTGEKTIPTRIMGTDQRAARQELSIWWPIFSNSVFTVAILTIACFYVRWKEF